MSIWDKKVGGTLFGNVLRKFGNSIAPGLLGTGKNMLKDENYDSMNSTLKDQVGVDINDPVDLNKYVTLPEIKVGMAQKTNWLLVGGLALIAGILLFKKK